MNTISFVRGGLHAAAAALLLTVAPLASSHVDAASAANQQQVDPAALKAAGDYLAIVRNRDRTIADLKAVLRATPGILASWAAKEPAVESHPHLVHPAFLKLVLAKLDGFEAELARLYASHLTAEELNAVTAFLSSPGGRTFSAVDLDVLAQLPAIVSGQAKPVAQTEGPDTAAVEGARELVTLTSHLPPDFAFRDQILTLQTQLYASRLAPAELQQALAFHRSAAGRKYDALAPKLAAETRALMIRWMTRIADDSPPAQLHLDAGE